MPVMPLMSLKRRLSDQLDLHVPSTKRMRLIDSDILETEIFWLKGDNHSNIDSFQAVSAQVPSIRRSTASMIEMQLSSIICGDSKNDLQLSNVEKLPLSKQSNPQYTGKPKDKGVSMSPMAQLTNLMPTFERVSQRHTPSPECREPGEKCLSMKLRQPSLVLVKMSPAVRKGSSTPCSHSLSSKNSGVVQGGYVHRMANLNAKARVAAFLLSERKMPSKQTKRSSYRSLRVTKPKVKGSSTTTTCSMATTRSVSSFKPSKCEAVFLNQTTDQKSIPVIHFKTTNGVDMPACAVIVHNFDVQDDDSTVPYNKLGMFYNGDTLHPHARVFLTQSVEHTPQLPKGVVPTLVPSRISIVSKAVRKAATTGIVNKRVSKVAKIGLHGFVP